MKDTYQEITDRILASVDDAGQWKPCWKGIAVSRPTNAVTKQPYRGVNILMCWLAGEASGFPTQEWASYRQWQTIGAQVKKGAKGTPIIFYKMIESSDPADEDNGRIFVRSSFVFNAAQVEGYEPAGLVEQLTPEERLPLLEDWLAERRHAISLTHSNDGRAYYRPGTDSVHMPRFELFDTPEAYYSTLFHELTHWTGAKHRLARPFSMERSEYPKEEMVAELGAAFLGAEFGIEEQRREDHTAYLAHWLKALKDDKRLIVRAASMASAAADYLTGIALEERIAA